MHSVWNPRPYDSPLQLAAKTNSPLNAFVMETPDDYGSWPRGLSRHMLPLKIFHNQFKNGAHEEYHRSHWSILYSRSWITSLSLRISPSRHLTEATSHVYGWKRCVSWCGDDAP